MARYRFVFVLLLVAVENSFSRSDVVVTTNVGKIAGLKREIEILGKRMVITEFLGIPYAEDTSGKNRFRRPVPKSPFKQTFNAFTVSPPCMQLPTLASNFTDMTEDCLMLNIFVPRDFNTNNTDKLPVMTWVHGGAFVSGSAKGYNGDALIVTGDVILVTINYRLAEFGFLNVGDARARGNQGLWDQHLAFKWIKTNIDSFLGDPDNITIFGESAGAGSVAIHSLYAGNKGLFTRVIAESGSALAYWATHEVSNVSLLYHLAGCEAVNDSVECLRQLSSNEFVSLLGRPEIANTGCCSKAPTVDGELIVEKPRNIMFGNEAISSEARQFFKSLDIMVGVNNGEGGLILLVEWLGKLHQRDLNTLKVSVSDFRNIVAPYMIAQVLELPGNGSEEALRSAILFEYVDWNDPDNNDILRKQLLDLSSDVAFFAPAVQTMTAHSSNSVGRSYLYEFSVEPPIRLLPTPDWFRGANHADEIQYVFGIPFMNTSLVETHHYVFTSRNGSFTRNDELVSLGMMTAWTNFAKSG